MERVASDRESKLNQWTSKVRTREVDGLPYFPITAEINTYWRPINFRALLESTPSDRGVAHFIIPVGLGSNPPSQSDFDKSFNLAAIWNQNEFKVHDMNIAPEIAAMLVLGTSYNNIGSFTLTWVREQPLNHRRGSLVISGTTLACFERLPFVPVVYAPLARCEGLAGRLKREKGWIITPAEFTEENTPGAGGLQKLS